MEEEKGISLHNNKQEIYFLVLVKKAENVD